MARDVFFADVRRGVSFMAPRVEADSPFTDTNYIQRMLRGTDLWLSGKVVEAFQPDEFNDVDEGVRNDLVKAVNEFRSVAETLDSHKPARPQQRQEALPPFTQIVKIVQELVLANWIKASTALLNEAEKWATEEGWPAKRYFKKITEDFIGGYRLDKLIYSVEGSQLALIPVGRFAPGTDGMFDLAVMPAYDSAMVVRETDRWFIHPLAGNEPRMDWCKAAFVSRSLELTRLQ